MCQGVQYSSQSPHSVDQSHVGQGHVGQQGQNTTIRPHPSWVVPTTAPESNVHIQPDQQAKSTTALPGHQSSSEPVHQSKDWGIQKFRAFRTLRCVECPMAPECISTKFSKCASTEDADSDSGSVSGGLADCRAPPSQTYGTYGRTAVGTPQVSFTLQSQTSALLQPQYSTHGTYHRMAVGRHQH